ncbi:hypothetical protein CRM22_007923 [Opisthorchis felineus]|uniref:1-acylglycerol-3-phosphate O-acyltransferase n=1 Tax=Opisthorchis felineus TaxID=147828 RepID=A0A4S2LKP7_OPIFE|nr:hypothetical protein CRM22_007923 [Opisthorchis felineus]
MLASIFLYACLGFAALCAAYRVPKVKFYLKYIIFCGVISVGSLYYIIEFSIRGRDYKNAWRFRRLFQIAGNLIGLKPIVKDSHYLTMEKPCIYVANHQSIIDVASEAIFAVFKFSGLVDVWPEQCTIISKASMKFAGPVGVITWLSKLIYIDRSKHSDAVSIMKYAATQARDAKVSVYVFPEGTRSCTGTMLPFKKGAFHLAIETQFPIQPIVITPYTRFLDFENKRFDDASYYVQVLPQISTTGMDSSNVDTLLNETREKMSACLEKLKTMELPTSH